MPSWSIWTMAPQHQKERAENWQQEQCEKRWIYAVSWIGSVSGVLLSGWATQRHRCLQTLAWQRCFLGRELQDHPSMNSLLWWIWIWKYRNTNVVEYTAVVLVFNPKTTCSRICIYTYVFENDGAYGNDVFTRSATSSSLSIQTRRFLRDAPTILSQRKATLRRCPRISPSAI